MGLSMRIAELVNMASAYDRIRYYWFGKNSDLNLVMILKYAIAICIGSASVVAGIDRPKGVSLPMAAHYDPSKPFTCLDGSAVIEFENINDDYCDCKDGSDEPGTSACSNGQFHCENKGHKSEYIPSSRVGDNICDCCDGSDEWGSNVQCENKCIELGMQARAEAERIRNLVAEGYKLCQEYSQQGIQARTEKQSRLEILEKERTDAEMKKNELEAVKNTAESPENEAKTKHQEAWDEYLKQKREERDRQKAEEAFVNLDLDGDNTVTISEIQTRTEFDIDKNGEVALDEAQEYLDNQEQVDLETFKEKVWNNIKEIYKPPVQDLPPPVEAPPTEPAPPGEAPSPDNDDFDLGEGPDDEDFEDEEFDKDEDIAEPVESKPEEEKDEEEKMADYDEETKLLIEAANKAREDFKEAENAYNSVNTEYNDIKDFLQLDLGEDYAFYPLKGNCYEYTDREYTYKICPYDKASQRSKHGGSETHLGTWGYWAGPPENKYSVMKFDHGTKCWNGPDRSATVNLHCGKDNILSSASEPNRCEYMFDLSTPAVCSQLGAVDTHDEHDEL